ncbi:MAG: ATP-binding protein [bacterium]
MEAVIFCGIPGSGKTTFYKERFAETHIRLSLDTLRTRHRERILLAACLEARQPFVIDNTNVTSAERARYIAPARAAGFKVAGYFFASDPKAAFARNRKRPGRAAVPAAGLFGAQKRLQPPVPDEGFDVLYRVEVVEGSGFEVAPLTTNGGVK